MSWTTLQTKILIDTIRFFVVTNIQDLSKFNYIHQKKYYSLKHTDITYNYFRDKYILHIIVNPKPYASITALEDFIKSNLIDCIDYNDLALSRVDYTVDVVLDSPDRVKEYLDLFRNLKNYKFMKMRLFEDSVYFNASEKINKGSATVRIYNKHVESKGLIPNTLRLEVSINRAQIKRMKQQYGLLDILSNYYSNIDCMTVLKRYIDPIIHAGDFFGFQEAKKRIKNSGYRLDYQKKLIDFVSDYSKYESKYLRKKYPTYARIIKALSAIGVNPLTAQNVVKNPFNDILAN